MLFHVIRFRHDHISCDEYSIIQKKREFFENVFLETKCFRTDEGELVTNSRMSVTSLAINTSFNPIQLLMKIRGKLRCAHHEIPPEDNILVSTYVPN